MYKLQLRCLSPHIHEFSDGASRLVVFRGRPLPSRHRALAATGRLRIPSGRFATALLAATIMLGALWLGNPDAAPAAELSLSDLGDRVCASHGSECRDLWNARMAGGDDFNSLVAAVCLDLRYRVHELDGIVCLETAIHAARSLPPGTLTGEAFASAVGTRDGSPPPNPDPQWTAAVASHIEGIPAYCDQTTPLIFEYFDCLLKELQTVKFALRHRVRATCSMGAGRLPSTSSGCGFPRMKRRAPGDEWLSTTRSAIRA